MKKILILLVVIAIVAAGKSGGGASPGAAAGKRKRPSRWPRWRSPRSRPPSPSGRNLTAYGAVEPSAAGARTVTLSYDCVVLEVDATVGARVAAGDVLARIEPTPDAGLQIGVAQSASASADKALAAMQQRY